MKKIILILCLNCFFRTVFAGGLHLDIREGIRFDDNINCVPKYKQSSLISHASLYAFNKTFIPNTSLKLVSKCGIGYNVYTENPSVNNYADSNNRISIKNDNISLEEAFLYTTDPFESELPNRAERIFNDSTLSLRTSPYNPFGLGCFVNNITLYYIESLWRNLRHNTINIGLRGYYNYSPKTNFFIEYSYGQANYFYDYNHIDRNFSIGLDGNLSTKIVSTIKASYATQKESRDDNLGIKEYHTVFGYSLETKWIPSPRNSIEIKGSRSLRKSIYGINNYYINNFIEFFATQKIHNKTTVYTKLAYALLDYGLTSSWNQRYDNYYRGKIGVYYKFKYSVFLGCAYEFINRESIERNHYVDNKVFLYIQIYTPTLIQFDDIWR
jgi:hypothetical protein